MSIYCPFLLLSLGNLLYNILLSALEVFVVIRYSSTSVNLNASSRLTCVVTILYFKIEISQYPSLYNILIQIPCLLIR
jgi:hypothetical protein